MIEKDSQRQRGDFVIEPPPFFSSNLCSFAVDTWGPLIGAGKSQEMEETRISTGFVAAAADCPCSHSYAPVIGSMHLIHAINLLHNVNLKGGL